MLVAIAAFVGASSTSPIAGLTGAPSENLCIDCHASFPLNSGPGVLTINGPGSYTPNQLYPVRVRLQQQGQSRWGFQITALSGANKMAGALEVVDSLRTQPNFSSSLLRSYINHRGPGTYADSLNGPVEWLVHWRAPSTNVGPVTFYASGNAANQNGDPNGDYIYATSLEVPPLVLDDTTMFRSFFPESLMTKKPSKRITASSLWEHTFVNTTGKIVSELEIQFEQPTGINWHPPFPDATTTDNGRTWVVFGQQIPDGATLTVRGTGPKEGTLVLGWRFGNGAMQAGFVPAGQTFLLQKPNSANLREEVFEFGGFAPATSESDLLGGMVIGKSFLRYRTFKWRLDSDSSRLYGWVRLKKSSTLLRSLLPSNNGIPHIGEPRGFCTFDNGRPFRRQQNNLTPAKMSNRLFAGVAALKMNIAASALGVTPVGFGELVYENNGHPLDELMVRQIADIADSLLTYCGHASSQYFMLDSVVRSLNGSFSGVIDTVSYADSLVLTGVRSLSEVPFLKANRLVPPTRNARVFMEEYVDTGEGDDDGDAEEQPVPELIQLAQSYPNPFNPTANIQFELHEFAETTVKVYDMLGREVRTLMEREVLFDGTNEVVFDASGLSSGIYFYRIIAESIEDPSRRTDIIGKMVMVK